MKSIIVLLTIGDELQAQADWREFRASRPACNDGLVRLNITFEDLNDAAGDIIVDTTAEGMKDAIETVLKRLLPTSQHQVFFSIHLEPRINTPEASLENLQKDLEELLLGLGWRIFEPRRNK
jgi:hypothetical protein